MSKRKAARWTMLMLALAGVIATLAVLACASAVPSSNSEPDNSGTQQRPELQAPQSPDSEGITQAEILLPAEDENSPSPPAPGQESGKGESQEEEPEQAPSATPAPTPTATPVMMCYSYYDPRGNPMRRCKPLHPPIIEEKLQAAIEWQKTQKEKARQARTPVEPFRLRITIAMNDPDGVDAVVEFLEANTDAPVWSSKKPGIRHSGASTVLDVELIPIIAEMDGVVEIFETETIRSIGRNWQQTPPNTLTAQELMEAKHWHDQDVKGEGVQVGIIDFDFRNFRTQVLPNTTATVRWLCFDANGSPVEGISSDPDADFAPCETADQTPTAVPHGTNVAAALLEIAPDVELFISNGATRLEVHQATEWLTAKRADNLETGRAYNVRGNDDFNVKVISFSRKDRWDGPGNGRSERAYIMGHGLLRNVDIATERGVV